MASLKNIAKSLMNLTPYEIRRKRLPDATLSPIELVLAYYLATSRVPTYVQIGACDGSSGDPTFRFTHTGKIRAWLVEPIPSSFAALQRTYEDVSHVTLVNAGIADTDGQLKMFRVKPEGRWANHPQAPQWSSMSKEHIMTHGVRSDEIEELTVPALTLQSLISTHNIPVIDILQIDVEGFDATIVQMALALSTKPKCINFEHLHFTAQQKAQTYPLLTSHNYRFVHDSWNTLAIHESFENELTTPGGSDSRPDPL